MKILMLGGSPHRHGTTRQLADAFADGAALAYLYRVGEVLDRIDGDQVCHVRVRLDQADVQKFKNSYPQVIYALS